MNQARASPDGQLLAYVTDNPGLPELFLTRFPSGEGRWQVTTEAARDPHWVRDTGELLFSTGLRQDTVFSVEVDATRAQEADESLRAVGLASGRSPG